MHDAAVQHDEKMLNHNMQRYYFTILLMPLFAGLGPFLFYSVVGELIRV